MNPQDFDHEVPTRTAGHSLSLKPTVAANESDRIETGYLDNPTVRQSRREDKHVQTPNYVTREHGLGHQPRRWRHPWKPRVENRGNHRYLLLFLMAMICFIGLAACGSDPQAGPSGAGATPSGTGSAATSGWATNTIDSADGSGTDISSVVFVGQLHVFSRGSNGELRHCWRSGGSWSCQTLDSKSGAGATSGYVWANQLHVFYGVSVEDTTTSFDGAPAGFGGDLTLRVEKLRHKWFNGTWHSEDFAADGGSVGDSVATALYSGNPHVFYSDCNGLNSCGISHKWWDGSAWHSEFWSDFGEAISTTASNNNLSVFYSGGQGQLAHRWFTPSTGWQFEVVDGPGGVASGAINCSHYCVADNGTSATVYQGNLHVFEVGRYSGVRHCSGVAGNWSCETLDTDAESSDQQYNSWSVGLSSADYGGTLHVFYKANNDLRHMWWQAGNWQGPEVLDQGSWLSPCGDYSSTVIWENQLQIFYQGGHNVRQAYWVPAAGAPSPNQVAILSPTPTPPSASPPLTTTPSPSPSTSPAPSPSPSATPSGSVLPSPVATSGFELRPNGAPYWLPHNGLAVPAILSGPGGTNSVSLQATYKGPDGGIGRGISITGTAGIDGVITDVSSLPLTLTIGANICCPQGVQAGGYVVYYIATVEPNLPIDYPGPNPGNNPPPCVRLDPGQPVGLSPQDPDYVNCPVG